jgi:transcriptional regulator
MYVPAHFNVSDLPTLHGAIERYSFALLVSQTAGQQEASHLPLLLNRADGPHGTLVGHMARANLQWQRAAGQDVLAIFSGPHAYISPQWYEAQHVVPTWNYVAVHASGPLQLIENASEVEALLRRTIDTYEAPLPTPWTLNEDQEFVDRLAQQIVAFRIPIQRIEGKWKLNQNHPAERRAKVAAALAQHADDNSRGIAALMRAQV